MATLLLVDDEKNIRDLGAIVLARAGHHVVQADSGAAARDELNKTHFDLMLLDYMMPDMDGLQFLEEANRSGLSLPPVVFMTAYGSVDTAVKAMKAGADDYLAKPFTTDELLHIVKRNLRTQQLEQKVADLERQVKATRLTKAGSFSSGNAEMQRIIDVATQAAASSAPVLIEGETGTGKERIAQLIHEASPRAGNAFVPVNCGALHPELLLSELFGHKRGAFTGAVENRVGKFEAANGGTLFLDEIGELDPAAQVKLLRVLQEGTFERVGDPRTYHVDVRIIAATNRRLEEMIVDESFRSDLYYRLAVVTLRVLPLRERPEDIATLARDFAREFAAELGRPQCQFSPEALQGLMARRWPGNIRELRNVVQRSIILTPANAPYILVESATPTSHAGNDAIPAALNDMAARGWTIDEVEKAYLAALLANPELKQSDICALLQIDSSTLWRKRKKYGV